MCVASDDILFRDVMFRPKTKICKAQLIIGIRIHTYYYEIRNDELEKYPYLKMQEDK